MSESMLKKALRKSLDQREVPKRSRGRRNPVAYRIAQDGIIQFVYA